jgi:hypothetical protein
MRILYADNWKPHKRVPSLVVMNCSLNGRSCYRNWGEFAKGAVMDNDKRWLDSHQAERGTRRPAPPASHPVDSFFETYGNRCLMEDENPVVKTTGLHNEEANVPDPVSAFIAKAESDRLHKSAGVADESWDREFAKTTVPDFSKRSEQRFERACAVVRRVFAGHPEECKEAIRVFRRTLDEERASIIADAAAA